MPLHLLGKKSWNVYNQANIDRVRRDEAAAQAKEEAEEARMQQEDAARRMAILRGERPSSPDLSLQPLNDSEQAALRLTQGLGEHDHLTHGRRDRKRRKLRGEDDTDRDIRFAREDAETSLSAKKDMGRLSSGVDVPVEDERGHIQLFSEPAAQKVPGRKPHERAPAQEVQKPDGHALLSNAAGLGSAKGKPWYTSQGGTTAAPAISDKDVWGNEDPRRKEREQSRLVSSDPFAMMQRAQTQLKASEKDKEKWREERQRELEDLRRDEKHRKRHKRRHRDEDDSLEEWDLNEKACVVQERRDRDLDRHRDSGSRHRHRVDPRRDREHRHHPHRRHRHRD